MITSTGNKNECFRCKKKVVSFPSISFGIIRYDCADCLALFNTEKNMREFLTEKVYAFSENQQRALFYMEYLSILEGGNEILVYKALLVLTDAEYSQLQRFKYIREKFGWNFPTDLAKKLDADLAKQVASVHNGVLSLIRER